VHFPFEGAKVPPGAIKSPSLKAVWKEYSVICNVTTRVDNGLQIWTRLRSIQSRDCALRRIRIGRGEAANLSLRPNPIKSHYRYDS
jgi:hypothetical protein